MIATLAWNGLHSTIVHFPIALLAVAPILIVAGLLPKHQGAFLASALIVMALGTAGAWLAVASGAAAGNVAERVPDTQVVLARHAEMGATTRTIFTALTLAFVEYLAVPLVMKREPTRAMRLGFYGAFLAVYAGALLCLANTAREGGRVAHEDGIHAPAVPGAVGLSLGTCAMGREGPGTARGITVSDVAVTGAQGSQRSMEVFAQRGTVCSTRSGQWHSGSSRWQRSCAWEPRHMPHCRSTRYRGARISLHPPRS